MSVNDVELFQNAIELYKDGHITDSMNILIELLKLHPSNPYIKHVYAECLQHKHEYSAAFFIFESLIDKIEDVDTSICKLVSKGIVMRSFSQIEELYKNSQKKSFKLLMLCLQLLGGDLYKAKELLEISGIAYLQYYSRLILSENTLEQNDSLITEILKRPRSLFNISHIMIEVIWLHNNPIHINDVDIYSRSFRTMHPELNYSVIDLSNNEKIEALVIKLAYVCDKYTEYDEYIINSIRRLHDNIIIRVYTLSLNNCNNRHNDISALSFEQTISEMSSYRYNIIIYASPLTSMRQFILSHLRISPVQIAVCDISAFQISTIDYVIVDHYTKINLKQKQNENIELLKSKSKSRILYIVADESTDIVANASTINISEVNTNITMVIYGDYLVDEYIDILCNVFNSMLMYYRNVIKSGDIRLCVIYGLNVKKCDLTKLKNLGIIVEVHYTFQNIQQNANCIYIDTYPKSHISIRDYYNKVRILSYFPSQQCGQQCGPNWAASSLDELKVQLIEYIRDIIDMRPILLNESVNSLDMSEIISNNFVMINKCDRFIRVLGEVCAVLYGAGITPILAGGSLLGYVREGNILKHDKDTDISILYSDIKRLGITIERLEHIFVSRGFSVVAIFGEVEDGLQFSVYKDLVSCDIFLNNYVLRGDEKKYAISCYYGYKKRFKFLYDRFEPKQINFRGIECFIPDDPIRYVMEDYGPNWNIPDSKFVWYQAPNCYYPNGYVIFTAQNQLDDCDRILRMMLYRTYKVIYIICYEIERIGRIIDYMNVNKVGSERYMIIRIKRNKYVSDELNISRQLSVLIYSHMLEFGCVMVCDKRYSELAIVKREMAHINI